MSPKPKSGASTTEAGPVLSGRNIRIGAQPIIWSNDDFLELGGDIPLDRCLREMREAGYAGCELGHKFPRDAGELARLLDERDLRLVSGWHSLYLVKNGLEREREGFEAHLRLLKALGCSVAIVAECTGRIYTRRDTAVIGPARPSLPKEGWRKLTEGLESLACIAQDTGLKLVYHHHMGTLVQDLSDIDRLMQSTKIVRLLADTGHLFFAGVEPLEVFTKYSERIAHVHLKDVRPRVVKAAKREALSFEGAVRRGVFTVPGDGSIDYRPLFAELRRADYEGWMVVEAEQDPSKAEPLSCAKKGRRYIKETAGL
ncbi:MAG: myo-inosose-2 dehydratase [Planctomycetota bacterium]